MWLDWLDAWVAKTGLADRRAEWKNRRAAASAPRRVAFIHVMKTAGSFVDSYLGYRVLAPRGYRIENSWAIGREADWTPEELAQFRATDPGTAMYVHNHVGDWPADTVRSYIDDCWFVFSFVRHPGDQWCSYYFWGKAKARGYWGMEKTRVFNQVCSLDEFLRLGFGPDNTLEWCRRSLDPPAYWRSLDFIDEYSDESFAWMLERHFGHRFVPRSLSRSNVSENPGYARCLAEGLVSESTDRLIRASQQFAAYEEIVAAGRARRAAG
ncbi:MAG: hypothetical protein EBZ59_01615 [Planctomycetia bacterium]|nr:hypothetical protein [Planctomycetia bacterium]